MPTVTQVASGNWIADAATVWDTGSVPSGGDDVDASDEYHLTLDGAPNTLASFTRSGSTGTFDFNGNDLVVTGDVTLDGIVDAETGDKLTIGGSLILDFGITLDPVLSFLFNSSAGTETLYSDISPMGNIEVDSSGGSMTLTSDIICNDLLLTDGVLVGTNQQISVEGDLQRVAGTPTDLTIIMVGTGAEVRWPTYNRRLTELIIANGATVSVEATTYVKKLTVTGVLSGTASLSIYNASAGWWGVQSGTVTCPIRLEELTGGPGNAMTVGGSSTRIQTDSVKMLTMDADLNCGDEQLLVLGNAVDDSMSLYMNGYSLTCGALTIGRDAGLNGNGKIFLTGSGHQLDSIAMGDAANSGNEFSMSHSSLLLTGTFDGTNITITSIGAHVIGGVVQDVDVSGVLHRWGATVDRDNSSDVVDEGSNTGVGIGPMYLAA